MEGIYKLKVYMNFKWFPLKNQANPLKPRPPRFQSSPGSKRISKGLITSLGTPGSIQTVKHHSSHVKSRGSQIITNTVDGSEIRRSPVEGTVVYLPLFAGFEIHPNGGCTQPTFGVTSAEVAIICPDINIYIYTHIHSIYIYTVQL